MQAKSKVKASYNVIVMMYIKLWLHCRVDWKIFVTQKSFGQTTYQDVNVPDTCKAKNEGNEALRLNITTMVGNDNSWEYYTTIIDHSMVAIKGVHLSRAVLVGKMSQGQGHWIDDTFKDTKVALEDLEVSSHNVEVEVEEK